MFFISVFIVSLSLSLIDLRWSASAQTIPKLCKTISVWHQNKPE